MIAVKKSHLIIVFCWFTIADLNYEKILDM